ncbi:MAG: endolytic transglycosylase MltG [Actinomycetota bacterium]
MADVIKVKRNEYLTFINFFAFFLVVVVIAVGIFFLRPGPHQSVHVKIKTGASTAAIAEELARQGVVNNAFLFKLYVGRQEAQNNLQAGEYDMMTGMTYAAALSALLKGPKVKYYSVTIPEGYTVAQTARRVARATPIKEDAFLAAARKSDFNFDFLKSLPEESLEGFLFPKTYTVTDKTTPKSMVGMMLGQFKKETDPLDLKPASERGLSLYQLITVASLIEKEVKVPAERPLVAAVIYNRLNRGMLLEFCSTVQYCLPEPKENLLEQDLKIDSPYNTYIYPGLPPGPIASPGLASIEAALNPAPVDYLYFVLTGSDGGHTFTTTYEDFLRAQNKQGM